MIRLIDLLFRDLFQIIINKVKNYNIFLSISF